MTCRFHICASPDYWKKHYAPNHPNDLKNHNCLVYSQSPRPDTWTFKDKNGKDISVKVKGNLRSDAANLLLDSVINGQGILIGPSYMIDEAMNGGQVITVLEDYSCSPVSLYAIYPYSKLVSTKVRTFVDYVIETWSDRDQA